MKEIWRQLIATNLSWRVIILFYLLNVALGVTAVVDAVQRFTRDPASLIGLGELGVAYLAYFGGYAFVRSLVAFEVHTLHIFRFLSYIQAIAIASVGVLFFAYLPAASGGDVAQLAFMLLGGLFTLLMMLSVGNAYAGMSPIRINQHNAVVYILAAAGCIIAFLVLRVRAVGDAADARSLAQWASLIFPACLAAFGAFMFTGRRGMMLVDDVDSLGPVELTPYLQSMQARPQITYDPRGL